MTTAILIFVITQLFGLVKLWLNQRAQTHALAVISGKVGAFQKAYQDGVEDGKAHAIAKMAQSQRNANFFQDPPRLVTGSDPDPPVAVGKSHLQDEGK